MRKKTGLTLLTLIIIIGTVLLLELPFQHNLQTIVITKQMPVPDRLELLSRVTFTPHLACWLLRFQTVRHGEYALKPELKLRELLELLWHGPQMTYKITIPEGMTSQQFQLMLQESPLFEGTLEGLDLPEGGLLPDTYRFARGAHRSQIVRHIMAKTQQVKAKLWTDTPQKLWKTQEEWVTFASLLEKEGLDRADREQIAGVLLNRLNRGMRLQVDATLVYIKTKGLYNKQIARNEIVEQAFQNEVEYDSPYNTYLHKGLPPGPIANPSLETLEVALKCEPGPYLYYRVIDGRHVFSKNFQTHKALKSKKSKNC